jgi:hypothetical protein
VKVEFFAQQMANQYLDYLQQETVPAFLLVRLIGLAAQQSV